MSHLHCSGDFVDITTETKDAGREIYRLCADNVDRDDFNNNGLGRVFYTDENVTVEFCSDPTSVVS